MAKKKIYKHHQRASFSDAKTDAQTRELVLGGTLRKAGVKFQDGNTIDLSPVVDVDGFGSISQAITDIGSVPIAAGIATAHTLSANTTISSTTLIKFYKGGSIALNGFDLTINGPVEIGNFQVFSGTGNVTFGNGSTEYINAKWFGAVGTGTPDDSDALDSFLTCLRLSAANYIRKGIVPAGFYRITRKLVAIDRNAVWIQGAGRQSTFIGLDATTSLVMSASGYNNLAAGDVGRTIACSTVQIRLTRAPSTFTPFATSDIGKTLVGGTSGATGRIVKYSNNGGAPWVEVQVLSGTFNRTESFTITSGTAGTFETVARTRCSLAASEDVAVSGDVGRTVTGGTSGATGILTGFLNTEVTPVTVPPTYTSTWRIKVTSGVFVSGEALTISGGTAGTFTINSAPTFTHTYTNTNSAEIQSYDNGTRTIVVKTASGKFWNQMGCTITGGTAGTYTLSADPTFSTTGVLDIHSTGDNKEYNRISDIGFYCYNLGEFTAIDGDSCPNLTIENVYTERFHTGIQLGNSWNTTVHNTNLVSCGKYGINSSSNGNDTCFLGVTITCDDTMGSRSYLLESCHGVSIKGGAQEDCEWAIEMQTSEVSYDGYSETTSAGTFLVTGNNNYLHILNAYLFNVGDIAAYLSAASTSKVYISQLRLDISSVDPLWLLDLASGSASAYYTIISATGSWWEPGGANFASVVSGEVEATINSPEFDSPVTISKDDVDNFLLTVDNSGGNDAIKVVAGNNKTNNDTERLLLLQAGDATDVLKVQSGGQIDATGTLNVAGVSNVTGPTLGTAIQSLKTTSSGDDPTETVVQNRITTTNGTITTFHLFTIPANTTVLVKAMVVARRTGGSAGTAEDGAAYEMTGCFKNVGGTATQIGSSTIVAMEDQAGWDCVFSVVDDVARIRVTGATDNNVTWHLTARTYQVSS